MLAEVENIDDECDQKGIIFVKIDNPDEAKEYGIDVVPSLIYFENTIPSLFIGTAVHKTYTKAKIITLIKYISIHYYVNIP